MFKGKNNSDLIMYAIMAIALFLAFQYTGSAGGFLVLIFIIGYLFYRRRAGMYHRKARMMFLDGDLMGAIEKMKKAISAAAGDSLLHASCGFMYLKMGRVVDAERMLTIAMNVAKTADEKNHAKSTMCLLLWKKGKLDEAIEMLEEVNQTYKTTTTYATMGFFVIERGIVDAALAYNKEAYEYNSKNPVILDNYGTTLRMAGQLEEAKAIYEALMASPPTFPDAYYNYGKLLELLGEDGKALDMYRTASSKKFWYTSTVTREEVDRVMEDLEEKLGIAPPEPLAIQSGEETEA